MVVSAVFTPVNKKWRSSSNMGKFLLFFCLWFYWFFVCFRFIFSDTCCAQHRAHVTAYAGECICPCHSPEKIVPHRRRRNRPLSTNLNSSTRATWRVAGPQGRLIVKTLQKRKKKFSWPPAALRKPSFSCGKLFFILNYFNFLTNYIYF